MNGVHRRNYLMNWMQNLVSILTLVQRTKTTNVIDTSQRWKMGFNIRGGGDTVFVNPPYSEISKWVAKCYYEGCKDNTTVVLLIPSRTDTKYFHNYIMHRAEIRFIKGRLKFNDGKGNAPFPSMLVIFRGAETKQK